MNKMEEEIKINKLDVYFAEMFLNVLKDIKCPMLLYKGEKEAVRKGLLLLLKQGTTDN